MKRHTPQPNGETVKMEAKEKIEEARRKLEEARKNQEKAPDQVVVAQGALEEAQREAGADQSLVTPGSCMDGLAHLFPFSSTQSWGDGIFFLKSTTTYKIK